MPPPSYILSPKHKNRTYEPKQKHHNQTLQLDQQKREDLLLAQTVYNQDTIEPTAEINIIPYNQFKMPTPPDNLTTNSKDSLKKISNQPQEDSYTWTNFPQFLNNQEF